MFTHKDKLEILNQPASLHEKLNTIHTIIKEEIPSIVRIAIAVYDPETKVLKTFIHSSGQDNPLDHYQTLLDDASSLKKVMETKKPRVINDLTVFEQNNHLHTQRIAALGYKASYTLPLYNADNFFGFMFFNTNKKNVFTEKMLSQIDIYAHMIALMVINELSTIKTLNAAIKTTAEITHVRDPETGTHLDRMARYSRLIASALATKYELDDSYIEHIFMFAPLHDIGKIGIPDEILLKPGLLDNKERGIMMRHAKMGGMMIKDILENFGLENIEHMDVLKNIAEYHHEAVNGTGYPLGIKGNAIPLEARIVAVADVFDALTSVRSYKKAWSNEAAIATLKKMTGETLDKDCVEALIGNMDKVEAIQKQFIESPLI